MVKLKGYATACEANETYHEIEEAYCAAQTPEELEQAREAYAEAIDHLAEHNESSNRKYGFNYTESLDAKYEVRMHELVSFPQLERL